MTTPTTAMDPLERAAAFSPDAFRRLAALEWRNREADWTAYLAALKALEDEVDKGRFTIRAWEKVHARAAAVVAPFTLGVEAATLAQQSLEQASLCLGALRDVLDRRSRSVLTVAYRAVLRDMSETP